MYFNHKYFIGSWNHHLIYYTLRYIKMKTITILVPPKENINNR